MPRSSQPIRLATRGSALALAQTEWTVEQCRRAFPRERFEIKIIKTTGDKLQTASLASANLPKGLFTKELESALLEQQADLAVHSLKDLPTELPAGLILGAVSRREDVRDILIWRRDTGLEATSSGLLLDRLPKKGTVATSSARRSAQLLAARPDLTVAPIRGNVGTRLRKLAEQPELAATILAAAGLKRLGFCLDPDGTLRGEAVPAGLMAMPISPEEMLPCVGQAAIGFEIRQDDSALPRICAALDDPETHACVLAERALLRGLGGGCQLAVAALATASAGQLHLRALSFLEGAPRRAEGQARFAEAEQLGLDLARRLRT